MICLCLNASTLQDNSLLVKKQINNIDLVELRADLLDPIGYTKNTLWTEIEHWVSDITATYMLDNGIALPIIFAIRLPQDGGMWQGDEHSRRLLLQQAVQSRLFRWIDIESNFDKLAPQSSITTETLIAQSDIKQAQLIISEHHFMEHKQSAHSASNNATLPDSWYTNILKIAKRFPSVFVKSAVSCNSSSMLCDFFEDCTVLQQEIPKRFVVAAMGVFGIPARILTAYTGSYWTYSSDMLEGNELVRRTHSLSHLGQLSPSDLAELYRYKNITRNSELYAIVGNPVMHSQSPAFHNEKFKSVDYSPSPSNKIYIHLPIDNISDLRRLSKLINFRGFSITIPHKETVLALLDHCEEQVQFCQSCNTILIDSSNKWRGYNTDIPGFLTPLYKNIRNTESTPEQIAEEVAEDLHSREILKGYNICIIGAGGSAKALSYALARAGANLLIVNRSVKKAQLLAEQLTQYLAGHLTTSESPNDTIALSPADTRITKNIDTLGKTERSTNTEVNTNQQDSMLAHTRQNINFAELTDYSKISQYDDIIVQTTGFGMGNDSDSPLPNFNFTGSEVVYDIIYTSPLTKLLQDAQSAGCTVFSGKAMFLAQAELQSNLFFTKS